MTGIASASNSTLAASFAVHYHRYLDPDGKPLASLPDIARDYERLRRLYRIMMTVRAFDQRAVNLQRTGQLGTYASCLGQEAIGAALGDAMAQEDVLLPTYRETPALLMRGVAMHEILLYWGGDEKGMDFADNRGDFPICIPIASQVPHAAGVAWSFKQRNEARVAACVLGDGGTSKGDFYEALNLAGAWQLPLLLLIVNNQWAISVPRSAQSGGQTLAQKAIAAGVGCEQVDGNDIVALHHRLALALDRCRKGGGPYLIEALTYRLSDHTTADDASRYRGKEELEQHFTQEPIARLRRYLEAAGEWNQNLEESAQNDCAAAVEAEVERYLETPHPPPGAMFDHLYATLPDSLRWQLREARAKGHGCG
ncbi:MAG: pyruvate dehydrogenase (acetyl-transferring) E1 component subunit alpha [Pseudomonas sp.]